MVTPVLPGTNPGPASRTAQLTKKEVRRLAKEANRLRLEKEGKTEEAPKAPKSVSSSSETPMDSEPPAESTKGSTGDKIVFTAEKKVEYELDVDVSVLDQELADFEKK